MAIAYVPYGNQKPFKADVFRQFVPRLARGPGRAGTIIAGVQAGIRLARKHYKFSTGLGSVATGAGVNQFGEWNLDETINKFGKAHRATKQGYNHRIVNRKAKYRKGNSKRCCCYKPTRRKNRY